MQRWERTECGKAPTLPSGWKWYIHDEAFQCSLKSFENTAQKVLEEHPAQRGYHHGTYIYNYFEHALYTHFEIANNFGHVRDLLNKTIQHANEYFWGSWRQTYERWPGEVFNEQQCRYELRWVSQYRCTLLAALLLDDNDNIQSIASWAGDGLGIYGEVDFTLNDVDWYVVLGRYLQGVSLNQQAEHCQRLKKSSRRRPKMNFEILEAIVEEDIKQIRSGIIKKVKYFMKSEITPDKPGLPMICIDFDASLLWNIARRAKIMITDFPEEIMDRIVTPQSMGLQN